MSIDPLWDDLGDEGIPPMVWLSFRDDQVRYARELVARAGIVAPYQAWRSAEQARLERHAGGAPERFPLEALLVAIAVAAIHDLPLLVTVFRDIMFHGISAAMRAELGIPDPPDLDDDRAWRACYRTVGHRLHRFLALIDPSALPKNRRLSPAEFDAHVERRRRDERLTDDVLAGRYARLVWVANRIIEASLSTMPRDVRRHWKGSLGVDDTPIPAFSRADRRAPGKGKREDRAVITHAADPDAAYYVRTDSPEPASKTNKSGWSYEVAFAVAVTDDPGEVTFPLLVVGMAPLRRPNKDIGANAITALASVRERGYPAGWLGADRAYSNSKPENYQLPARGLGYQLILNYRDNQLGVQGSHEGALLIEGAWYCPGIPQDLIDATVDRRAGRIDDQTYVSRIEARRAFRMRPKAGADDEGHVRLLCPASDGAPTGRCDLKPNSINPKTAGRTRIPVTDALCAQPPKVCTQQSTTFPPEAGAKLLQTLHYGAPEWRERWGTVRSTNEGVHAILKDGARGALHDPERRRIRGVAAQTIFTAFIVMAANLRAIISFARHARRDPDGIRRRPRKRRRSTDPLRQWQPDTAERSGDPPP